MIDIAFLIFITLFTIVTPKGEYRRINEILTAKFLIFIGLHYLTVGLGFFDGDWVDVYRANLDILFVGLFLYFGGYYLAFLCFLMAGFHIYNIFFYTSYFEIMFGFQILQLCAASWGMIDGISNKYFPHPRGNSSHNHRA